MVGGGQTPGIGVAYPLLSLPPHMMEMVVGHLGPEQRELLLRTCKALRQAVLTAAAGRLWRWPGGSYLLRSFMLLVGWNQCQCSVCCQSLQLSLQRLSTQRLSTQKLRSGSTGV